MIVTMEMLRYLVVFGDGGPRAPTNHSPIPMGFGGAESPGSRAGPVPQPVPVQQQGSIHFWQDGRYQLSSRVMEMEINRNMLSYFLDFVAL